MKQLLHSGALLLILAVAGFSVVRLDLPLQAQSADILGSKVDALLGAWDKPAPGVAIAVVRNGAVVYKRGVGLANLEYDIPITPATVFNAASVAKQFTAFAIAILANEGKLSLDDDIRRYIPEIPDFGKTITVRHLIHHTSGLRDYWELLGMAGWRETDLVTREQALEVLEHQTKLNFDPGDEHVYSNSGYALLPLVVERLSGQSFAAFTADRIFKPLGMMHTQFVTNELTIIRNRAHSYASTSRGFAFLGLNSVVAGPGSLFTTAEDLAQWIVNLDTSAVGGRAVLQQMQSNGVLSNGNPIDYGFGLTLGTYRGARTVGHGGGAAGYRSHVLWLPEHRFGVAVLSNSMSFFPPRIVEQIADIYLGGNLGALNPQATVEAVPAKVNPDIYDRYAGSYLLDDWMLVSITREGDRLFGQPAGQPKAELVPLTDTQFFIREAAMEIAFERDANGRATGFISTQRGKTQRAGRVEIAGVPPADLLSEFAGEYYSPELATVYTLAVRDGQLVAQHRRRDDIKLTRVHEDRFTSSAWFLQRIHFTRDGDNDVAGFRASTDRARNVRFDRRRPKS